ncbi:MAG TPA: DUF58 domain-containing protein [Armatimonadota bacterium]|jgi:uncharacterized protein (DUF58 family)
MLPDLVLFILILAGVAVMAIFLNKRLLTLLLSSVFLLLVAMRLNVTNMYLMGTVLLTLPFASYAVGWFGGRYLNVKRSSPEAAFEGESIPVRVDVLSPMALFSAFATVVKRLPPHVALMAGSESVVTMEGGVRHTYQVRADRRGVYNVADCTVGIHDPLGIWTLRRRYPQASSLTVYPTGLATEETKALGESTGGWLVQTTVQRRGEEEGFYGTREYRVGDDLRRIHWRSSARHGALVVVERERAASGRIWLLLDTLKGSERGTDADPTMERAVKVAVTVMENSIARGEAVGLLAPGPAGAIIPPDSGDTQRWRILDALARVQAEGSVPLAESALSAPAESGSTMVFLTGAPTEDMIDAIPALRRAGVGVVAAPVETAAPMRSPAYSAMRLDDFLIAAEAAGAQTLRSRLPVFAEALPAPDAAARKI